MTRVAKENQGCPHHWGPAQGPCLEKSDPILLIQSLSYFPPLCHYGLSHPASPSLELWFVQKLLTSLLVRSSLCSPSASSLVAFLSPQLLWGLPISSG